MSEMFDFPILSAEGMGMAMSLGISHRGYLTDSRNGRVMGYGGDIAIGQEVSAHLAIGALLSVKQSVSNVSVVSAIASTFGVLYAPSPEISYTAVFNGAGSGIRYGSNADSPDTSCSTSSDSMRFPSAASMRKPFLLLALSNEKIIGEHGLVYRGGIEVLPSDFLALRFGYGSGAETNTIAFGVGLAISGVRVDYALSREDPHGIHYASVSIEL